MFSFNSFEDTKWGFSSLDTVMFRLKDQSILRQFSYKDHLFKTNSLYRPLILTVLVGGLFSRTSLFYKYKLVLRLDTW